MKRVLRLLDLICPETDGERYESIMELGSLTDAGRADLEELANSWIEIADLFRRTALKYQVALAERNGLYVAVHDMVGAANKLLDEWGKENEEGLIREIANLRKVRDGVKAILED